MKSSPRSHIQTKPLTVDHTPEKDNKLKKCYSKSNSKEKDKTASTDCHTMTKTTFFIHSRKGNNSSAQNYSETTLSSQLLRDSEPKEQEPKTRKLTPFKETRKVEKNESVSPLSQRHENNKERQRIMDWEKVLSSKEKKIKDLREMICSIQAKIDQAMEFIEGHKVLPNLLQEKESELEILNNHLIQVMQEMDNIKLDTKRKSIPDMQKSLGNPLHSERDEYSSHINYEKKKNSSTKQIVKGKDFDTRYAKKLQTIENNGTIKNKGQVCDIKNINNQTRTKKIKNIGDSMVPTNSLDEAQQKIDDDFEHKENARLPKFTNPGIDRGFKSHRDHGDLKGNQETLMKILRNLKRSLSPDGASNSNNQQKFKMYAEDPMKKLVPQYFKSKQSKLENKNLLKGDSSKFNFSTKNIKAKMPIDSNIESYREINFEKDKVHTKRLKVRHRGTSSLSPKRELLLTQKIRIFKGRIDFQRQKASIKTQTSKFESKKQSDDKILTQRGEKSKDPIISISGLLEDFYLLAEKYKKMVETLETKNKKLEKQVLNLIDKKMKN